MAKLNTKQNFLNVLIDCFGYSELEAKEEAKEYRNKLTDYITDRGGDNYAIQEAKEFCELNK